jgi:hypothetical protein
MRDILSRNDPRAGARLGHFSSAKSRKPIEARAAVP